VPEEMKPMLGNRAELGLPHWVPETLSGWLGQRWSE